MGYYFLWFFFQLFLLVTTPYSFLEVGKLGNYYELIGVLGFILILIAVLISYMSESIAIPIFLVGIFLTGAVSVVYPITNTVKIGSVVYSEIASIFNDSRDETDYINQNRYDGYDSEFTENDNSDTHHVDPHWVDGYERSDGTQVDGYWRGGADGYERSNPDGDTGNNLDSGGNSGMDWDFLGW